MTMEPTATRARTQGDKGQPFRPQRNARFERAARMQTPAARGRARACMRNSAAFPGCTVHPIAMSASVARHAPTNRRSRLRALSVSLYL